MRSRPPLPGLPSSAPALLKRPAAERLRGGLERMPVEPWVLALAAILLLALALRLWGIKYGLPFAYQIDEERIYVRKAARMLEAGSLNPHYMHNPPLLTYLLQAIFGVLHGGGRANRLLHDVPDRTGLFLTARLTVALIGTLAVALTFVAARRFFDRRTGLLAALLMAVAFLPVFYSHVALNNVPAMAAALASLIGTAGILTRGETRDYLLAGAFVGVAAATKYLDGIVVVPMLTATLLAPRGPGAPGLRRALALGAGSALAAFLICNPFALIKPAHFIGSLGAQGEVVGRHKFGQDPNGGIAYYLRTFTSATSVVGCCPPSRSSACWPPTARFGSPTSWPRACGGRRSPPRWAASLLLLLPHREPCTRFTTTACSRAPTPSTWRAAGCSSTCRVTPR
jgi:4-amino-4-deoxy-L-arabinose transferase-like glycosyltransferase